MRTLVIVGIAAILSVGNARQCLGADFASVGLADAVDFSTVIAKVQIVRVDEVKSDKDKSLVCGYHFQARVLEQYKGPKIEVISFYSHTSKDLANGAPHYLLMASQYKDSKKFFSEDGEVCNSVSVEYFIRNIYQSLFPFFGSDDDDLLVGRISPFTPGNFVSPNDLIIDFVIGDDDRIYARVDWKKALGKIETYIH